MKSKLPHRILNLLPGFNCDMCGYSRCDEFVEALLKGKTNLEACMFLFQERFHERRLKLEEILKKERIIPEEEEIIGLLDGYLADFILKPLPDEGSCREILYPFAAVDPKEGDVIRYRPLGCPIIHFARIIQNKHGLLKVHIVGPCHRLGEDFRFTEIGVCMVAGFEGVIEGKLPSIGETVRFLPKHCMMQKIHSGVVVQLEGRRAIIEGIDLKVWAPPIKG